MSPPPKPPVFLHRASYRQRRLRDAAKLLPFVAMVLWAMPLAWNLTADEDGVGSEGVIYIFGVWFGLILLSAFLASLMRSDPSIDPKGDAP